MTDRNIGLEILDGIKEIKAFKDSKADLVTRVLADPSHPKEIRARLNQLQSASASLMGVIVRTVQDWGARQTGAMRPGKITFTNSRTTS